MGHNHSKEERSKKIISNSSRPRTRTGTVKNIFEKVFRKSKADDECLASDGAATIFPCTKSLIITTTNDGPRTQLMERQSTSNISTTNNAALNISPRLLSFDYLQTGRLKTFDEYGRERVDENNNILLSNPRNSSSLECNATQSSTLAMHSYYTNGNDDAAVGNVMKRNRSSSASFEAPSPKFWGKAMYKDNNVAVYNVQTARTTGASTTMASTTMASTTGATTTGATTTVASKSKTGKGIRHKTNPPNKKIGKGSFPGGNVKGKKMNSQANKKVENSKGEIKKHPDKSEKVIKTGCCKPVAPPVFIEAFNRSSGADNYGRGNCCNPADRLKNVDVVEELLYYVPTPDICNDSDDNEFDYYCINECGDMELVPRAPKESPKNCSFNPVKYSRRQCFNFKDNRSDEPPFPWLGPQTKSCCCQCCKAGLRRNPKCCCACCAVKGVARVSNSFDEIPVGRNPQIQAKNFDAPCTPISEECTSSSEESSDNCENVIPKESGLYFYDANRQRFVRQEPPLTPEPVCVTNVEPPPPPPPPPPPKKKPTIQPVVQPVVMQPPCPPPPCPPKPCCCENGCNCKCRKETPPPTFVPVMMCGGYNGGNSRCRPRYCGPPCCMPNPCGPPCYPNPYQYPPQGPPQNYPQKSQSRHSSNTGGATEEHSTESEETPTGSGSMDEDITTITASVTRHENSIITSIVVPPGQKGDIKITS